MKGLNKMATQNLPMVTNEIVELVETMRGA